MDVLITGAAGNLGGMLARHMLARTDHSVRLMVHKRDVADDLKVPGRSAVVRADLARPQTLDAAVEGVEAIVHFAGVLFRPRPEQFLPVTNTQYFRHLVDAATARGVRKVVLISFPHVEGPTSVAHPARGRLDAEPISVHARTRLAEERYLFDRVPTPVSLRVGMVYGAGMLMVDAARWLARRRLLGAWPGRTQIHLISKADFCVATTAAIENPRARGIYHLGDDGDVSLQEFLDVACEEWCLRPPWRVPMWVIRGAAWLCELVSRVGHLPAPLTRDFIEIGAVPYYGDTTRMKEDLLPVLRYPTLAEGRHTLRG